MEWVPLTDYENGMNLDDRPRRLTHEEIVFIVSHIPNAPAADSTASEVARQGVVEWMIETLKEIFIAPSAIPDLINKIIYQHNKSLVVPGTPIGITAAEAVGATTTQMTLNSVAPWERIIIQDRNGKSQLIKIGEWIDGLIRGNVESVKNIPENRTEYLELDNPVFIATPNEKGKVTWDKVTAVTKHLPVGDMIKIITKSGKEVTATQSKSLLIWDGDKLVQREGSSVKIGESVPILCKIPDPPIVFNELNGITLTKSLGMSFGDYISKKDKDKSEFDSFMIDETPSSDILFGNNSFLEGILLSEDFNKAEGILGEFKDYIERRIGRREPTIEDIILDEIISIEFVTATEYVYDLTVPTTTNFSLWNGIGTADTFHTSGSVKSASFGIEAMRDLIFARKTPKNESSTIYYTNKSATYEEILDTRRYIVGSVVKDFIIDHDIDSPDVLPRYWWHDTVGLLLNKEIPQSNKVLRLFLNTVEMFKHRVTIKELAAVLEREIPPSAVAIYGPISDGIIDLYPHPTIITETLKGKEKGAIPPDLAEVTYLESVVMSELSNIRVKGISGIKNLYPLISPVWRIVLLERKLEERDLITPELREGLGKYLGFAWLLFYNLDIMKMTGLTPENLAALCQLAGLTIIAGTTDRLIVGMPNDRFRTSHGDIIYNINDMMLRKIPEGQFLQYNDFSYKEVDNSYFRELDDEWSEEIDDNVSIKLPRDSVIRIDKKLYKRIDPTLLHEIDGSLYEEIVDEQGIKPKITELKPNEYVSSKVNEDKHLIRKRIDELTKQNIEIAKTLPPKERRELIRKKVIIPRTNLMKAAEFVIAETDGSNLKELLALPGIDKRRTTCSNMYSIQATLGIEAARTFLIRSLTNTISNTGSYVHPANITFIAEFITSRGEPYGATYTGISRQPGGHLSLATVERAGKVFTQSALHGRKEDIRNVSASVAVGARMAIGTGSFDIAQDITENGIKHTIINDDLFTALEKDDESKRLLQEINTPVTISPDDLLSGIESLKELTVGGASFDYVRSDDEVNLINMNPTEMYPEPEVSSSELSNVPRKIVKRVQPQPILDNKDLIVPSDLIDTIAQIKVGVPLTDSSTKSFIKPLETGITPNLRQPVPIISSGLIPFIDLAPVSTNTGIPSELSSLLDKYFTENVEPVTVVTELPTVEIPELPNLEGMNLGRDTIELRREQVRDLTPVNIDNLQNNLFN